MFNLGLIRISLISTYLYILDYAVHFILLGSEYKETSHLWRDPRAMQSLMWIAVLVYLLKSIIFEYLFDKEKSIFLVSLLVAVESLPFYICMPITANIVVVWALTGFLSVYGSKLIYNLFK